MIIRLVISYWIFVQIFQPIDAEPISIITGITSLIGAGIIYVKQHDIKCRFYECCDKPYINPRMDVLRRDLTERVYGQHLVADTVLNAVSVHLDNRYPRKPLVMSFHGSSGSGKNYVAEIIANATYKKGMKSEYVHHIVSTFEFPDKSRMHEYQLNLRQRVHDAVKKCGRSLFIFDEMDKMPEQLIASIKPFLDYYDNVGGVDFRRSIFIFLSNLGGNAIAEVALKHHSEAKLREGLVLANFEKVLTKAAYNEEGGLRLNDLIGNNLIDHFVPFLPLERKHVELCTYTYLKKRGYDDLAKDSAFVKHIIDSLVFYPANNALFSSSGCKKIAQKSDLEIGKSSYYQHSHGDHIDDEL